MRIAIIHGNDGSDVRIGKTCRSLSRMGHDVHFIGWARREGPPAPIDLGTARAHVMKHPTRHGRLTVGGQWRFWRHVVAVLSKIRPRTVCCVNEDCALLVLPLRGLLYDRLVCDVFDALVDRHSHRSWPVRSALRAVSEIVRVGADRLIATDADRFERFGRSRRKCTIVENVPEDPGESLARRLPTGPTRIYVAGSLSRSRGLRQIIEAVEPLDDLRIVSAGWLYDDYAAGEFHDHPKVSFHGVVSARESLELACQCDAVAALYAPTSVNNRHASPNKVYDALSVGRPVLINEEIRVARWVRHNELGWTFAYDDVSALRQIIASLRGRRADLGGFARRARRIFLDGRTWSRMEDRLRDLYDALEA